MLEHRGLILQRQETLAKRVKQEPLDQSVQIEALDQQVQIQLLIQAMEFIGWYKKFLY